MPKPLKVLFLASEMVPFAKTGGLADVAGSLPPALRRLGPDVRAVLPLYRSVREGHFSPAPLYEDLPVPLGTQTLTARVLETRADPDVPVYLLERQDLFDRPHLYGDARGDYYDNLERYSFFAHGALQLAARLGFTPDIIHCNDWQTGLVPALLRGPYRRTPQLQNAAAVFTVHNLGYQGLFPPEKLGVTGLRPEEVLRPDGLEFWGQGSLLKSGLVYAEALTTVSPQYAKEIQTPEFGMGLDGLLRERSPVLHGILNGIDYETWDPAHDTLIAAPYSPAKLILKAHCKGALIECCGLQTRIQSRPLLAMISRLDAQKGLDLLLAALPPLMEQDVGLVILGVGDDELQNALLSGAERYAGRMRVFTRFDEPLAHRIVAGADMFLIPSRYEPCGLTQMYALKYGTVPIVRATGGLQDTVVPFDAACGDGNGFKFGPYESDALLAAAHDAIALYGDAPTWQKLMLNGMHADFSWDRSAAAYLDLFHSVLPATGGLREET